MVQAFSRPSSRGPVISIHFYPLCGCFHKKLIKESHGPHSGIGFKLKPRATDIPCLLFADDNLLLCKAAASSCNNLKSVIDDFCDASDQLVNFHKSNIVFSKKSKHPLQGFPSKPLQHGHPLLPRKIPRHLFQLLPSNQDGFRQKKMNNALT